MEKDVDIGTDVDEVAPPPLLHRHRRVGERKLAPFAAPRALLLAPLARQPRVLLQPEQFGVGGHPFALGPEHAAEEPRLVLC